MERNSKQRRFLFAIDLDGTLLANSATGAIHPKTEEQIKRAVNEGHIVSIITGRPWRSTKHIYEKLGLNSIVGNYNGAHIHSPNDPFFIPTISYLDLNEVLYILGDPKVEKEISNYAIEGPDWVQLKYRDEALEKVFNFSNATKFRESIELTKLPLKPTGIVFDVKPETNVKELLIYLKRRYGDLGEFSSWSKGEGLTPVFDITSIGVTKGNVISLIMRYYNIDIDDTIAMGDSFNDSSMFRIANVGMAPANAEAYIKALASDLSNKTNKDGAVGYFMEKFLNNPDKYIKKAKKFHDELDKERLQIVGADHFNEE
ncbi:Cof-type HAD-IIB family hydrolase [Mycoplasma miroungirhinis]|uniref:HAD family phosphatase n=1 Tax=Mycoplasma miroungirhinis TaxID=754516 RepID=A0A6M4JAR9_9MOLU|nr:Cof-type HAD-IIB family hydrolase [Mycoplasma miroungirhinis]QJR44000.1 HAD family phosphatase [Mycoplasma miroungirhinis]